MFMWVSVVRESEVAVVFFWGHCVLGDLNRCWRMDDLARVLAALNCHHQELVNVETVIFKSIGPDSSPYRPLRINWTVSTRLTGTHYGFKLPNLSETTALKGSCNG